MKQLGLQNFRRFADYQQLEFGNINFFVGCNNSGKSTVVKAILLIFANLNNLLHRNRNSEKKIDWIFDFAPELYYKALHIGSFSRAVNINHRTDNILFDIDFGLNYKLSLEIGKNEKEHFSTSPLKKIIIKDVKYEATFTIDYTEKTVGFKILKGLNDEFKKKASIENLKRVYQGIDQLQKESVDKNRYIVQLQADISKNYADINRLKHYIETSEEEKREDVSNRMYHLEQLRLEFERNLQLQIAEKNNIDVRLLNLTNLAKNIAFQSDLYNDVKIETQISFDNLPVRMPFVNATIEDTRLNSVYFNSLIQEERNQYAEYQYIAAHDDYFGRVIRAFSAVPAVDYIHVHAISQDTFYKVNDKYDYMSQTIQNFFNSDVRNESEEHLFIVKWMRLFKIGSGYEITPIDGNEGYYVKIISESGKSMNLAEKGIGSIQLMILLFKVATLIKKFKNNKNADLTNQPLVLIEEPEQNLHPSIQALLAEFFYDINSLYNIRFIVETHSEYIIRRVQSLLAEDFLEGKVKKVNPFKVFYFPENGSVYDMNMTSTGRFNNSFDEGFFDVAAKLNMKVFSAERQKNNV
jgi:predicted ATPase